MKWICMWFKMSQIVYIHDRLIRFQLHISSQELMADGFRTTSEDLSRVVMDQAQALLEGGNGTYHANFGSSVQLPTARR